MRNERPPLHGSMQRLGEFFETFCDAVEIADWPLPLLFKLVAIRSRDRSALMLKEAIDEVIRNQHEEDN